MRPLIWIFLLACLSVNSLNSFAGSIWGAGGLSCGTWFQYRQSEDLTLMTWIQGFLSSYNHFVYSGSNPNGIFGSADNRSIVAWMDNYCQRHPLESVYEGTLELIEELKQREN